MRLFSCPPISTEPGYSYLFLRFLSSTILASNPVSRYLSEYIYLRPFWSHVFSVYGLMGYGNRWVLHFLVSADLKLLYAVEPPPTAISLHRPLFFVQEDSPYTDSCLNLSTTATATKASVCPTAKTSSLQRPVFSVTDGKVKNGYEISSVWRVDD